MKVLSKGPSARGDRYATELLHDEANARIVAFQLEPGQEVPPHHSESTVVVLVTRGSARFTGAGTEAVLRAGDAAAYEPGEEHAIYAEEEAVRFLAMIAPGPSMRAHLTVAPEAQR
jgi:quercetin dioxygenase-like cupin family protein